MKIVIFSDNFYPELSGITDSLLVSSQELAKRGHQLLLVAPHYLPADYAKVDQSITEPDYGPNVKVIRLPSLPYPNSPNGQGRMAVPIGFSFRPVKDFGPDLIHTHSPFGVGLEGLLVSKLLRIPLMGTNHTPPSEFMAYSPIQAKWFTKLTLGYFAWYYNRCRSVTTPCRSLLDEMNDNGFRQPAEVLPNPVDLSHFRPAENTEVKAKLKQQFGFSDKTILYTGRLAEEKHIDVIIKALALVKNKIPGVMLAITGHGAAAESLKKLAMTLDLENQVKFLGFIGSEKFLSVYQASDLFVIMSTAESQSLSLMQAMATGLPVIGARARALPEYINQTNGLVVTPGDEVGLAEAMVQILTNTNKIQILGTGGVARVKQFLPVEIVDRLEILYNKVITQHE